MSKELIGVITTPLFTGAIGYVTNWTGIWMLFNPVHFKGVRLPGLATLAQLLPRKIQQVPGIMNGGVGWQGIIPSRAAKMGSIAVDKGIAKVGSPEEFFGRLDQNELTRHIVDSSREDMRAIVERAIEREHPQLWRQLTPELREAALDRVERELPAVVDDVVVELRDNIDHLLDIKLMVIRHIEAHPELANKIFRSVGERELRFIINFGFFFGFGLGIPIAALTALGGAWVLFICGPILGWVTNWLAIVMIFEPVEWRRVGPFKWKGLFLRRQREVADVYAEVVASDVVTVENIADELLHGASADRTRRLIMNALRPSLDQALGGLRPAVRLAVGPREYGAIREALAEEGAEYAIKPLAAPDFNRRQAERIEQLMAEQMRDMPPADFSEMLRSAIRQDEWLLLAHGGALGVLGGAIHFLAFA
jgi:uncharacterized membrane protein YheB (UPF0754 family)